MRILKESITTKLKPVDYRFFITIEKLVLMALGELFLT